MHRGKKTETFNSFSRVDHHDIDDGPVGKREGQFSNTQ